MDFCSILDLVNLSFCSVSVLPVLYLLVFTCFESSYQTNSHDYKIQLMLIRDDVAHMCVVSCCPRYLRILFAPDPDFSLDYIIHLDFG